jgi:hypothetical protein
MGYLLAYMCLVIVFVVFTLLLCYMSFQNSPATATDPTTTNSQATAATDQTNTSDGDRQKHWWSSLLLALAFCSWAWPGGGWQLGIAEAEPQRHRYACMRRHRCWIEAPLKASLGVSFFTCLLGCVGHAGARACTDEQRQW